jgi:hypothetical protein
MTSGARSELFTFGDKEMATKKKAAISKAVTTKAGKPTHLIRGFRFVVLEDGRAGALVTAVECEWNPRTYEKWFEVLGDTLKEARERAALGQAEGRWRALFGRDLGKAKAHTFSALKSDEQELVERWLLRVDEDEEPLD